MKTISKCLTVVLLASPFFQTFCSDKISLKSLGMGRAAIASSRGTDAIGVNPANLALSDDGRFQISIAPTFIDARTELFTSEIFKNYFTGVDTGGTERAPRYLTAADKQIIRNRLSAMPDTRIDVESMLAGFTFRHPLIGGMGFAMIEHVGSNISLARDYIDLLFLEGLQQGRKYILDGTSLDAWWYREYNVSYGRKLPFRISFLRDVEGGLSLKMLHGYGIYKTEQGQGYVDYPTPVSDTSINRLIARINFATKHAGVNFINGQSGESFKLFPAPVGKGFGLDIGFSGELENGIRIGASVTDIGSIQWNNNISESLSSGTIDYEGFDLAVKDSLEKMIDGVNRSGDAFSTPLPTILHLGAMVDSKKFPLLSRVPGQMLISFEYAQGFNHSLGNTTQARFSLGAEYRYFSFFAVRTGILLGGNTGFHMTGGIGLDFNNVAIDIATNNFGTFFSNTEAYALSFGAGIKIRF